MSIVRQGYTEVPAERDNGIHQDPRQLKKQMDASRITVVGESKSHNLTYVDKYKVPPAHSQRKTRTGVILQCFVDGKAGEGRRGGIKQESRRR